MSSNRERALDAAVELLGTEGSRALTHLRVDERAGLPRGSTSNHFRTRAALLRGVVAHMVDRESLEVAEALVPGSPDQLVDHVVGLFEFMTGPNRVMTMARLVLLTEAERDPELRRLLAEGRTAMARLVQPAFAALGARDPQFAVDALAVCFEGLFLHTFASRAQVDARRVIDLTVRANLGGT